MVHASSICIAYYDPVRPESAVLYRNQRAVARQDFKAEIFVQRKTVSFIIPQRILIQMAVFRLLEFLSILSYLRKQVSIGLFPVKFQIGFPLPRE